MDHSVQLLVSPADGHLPVYPYYRLQKGPGVFSRYHSVHFYVYVQVNPLFSFPSFLIGKGDYPNGQPQRSPSLILTTPIMGYIINLGTTTIPSSRLTLERRRVECGCTTSIVGQQLARQDLLLYHHKLFFGVDQ